MSVQAILISSDLIFISKVKEVARVAQATITVARSISALESALTERAPGVLLLDLEKPGAPLEGIVPVFTAALEGGWKGISFFSHVHEELEVRANELGLGAVLPRSLFVKRLPDLLKE